MAQIKLSAPASRNRWGGSVMVAVALAAAASLGGCAGTSDFAGANAPYQIAGPVVANGPAHPDSQGCSGGISGFVDTCSGFARYYGP